ncbi:phage holin family protein [Sporosarcina sp. FSL K6-5500]|uniref:phage holin family protein n=1 Tax=Sporosarcina sp. FSL K6-5500 TaxID=2921558 RepID=UPI001A90E69C|nr:phage holin family protein [Sporosarcina sp. E16_8]MBO0586448.1 phage holin family protein [Sporosarcina sp. E16_8]
MGGFNLGQLEIVHMYLFGGVKFLHFLLILMALDIITGIFKAYKNENLWSRKSLFGYARKMLVLVMIIMANIIDQILGMSGAVTYATVLFYIVNEALSIMENMAELGVLVPAGLASKLKVIESSNQSFSEEIREELIGSKVDHQLNTAKIDNAISAKVEELINDKNEGDK